MLMARGERQLRRAIKRFREEGANYSSKLENATSQDFSQARTVIIPKREQYPTF